MLHGFLVLRFGPDSAAAPKAAGVAQNWRYKKKRNVVYKGRFEQSCAGSYDAVVLHDGEVTGDVRDDVDRYRDKPYG